jgi:hypothetical protein
MFIGVNFGTVAMAVTLISELLSAIPTTDAKWPDFAKPCLFSVFCSWK